MVRNIWKECMLKFGYISLNSSGAAQQPSCILCATRMQEIVEASPAPFETVAQNIDSFDAQGFDGIALGCFEPFAHPRLVEILHNITARGTRRIALHTDGGALSSYANAEGSLHSGARIFEIPWLGATSASHDALTKKPGLFAAFHQGIANVQAAAHQAGFNIFIVGVLAVCEHNVHEVLAMAQDALEAGVDALRLDVAGCALSEETITALYDCATTRGIALYGEQIPALLGAQLITYVSVSGEDYE